MQIARAGLAWTYFVSFAGWTVIGLFYFSGDLMRRAFWPDRTSAGEVLLSWMVGVLLCALITPPVLWIARGLTIERRYWVRRIAQHLLLGVGFSLLSLSLQALVVAWVGILPAFFGNSFLSAFATLMVIGFHSNVLAYWTILGIDHAVRYYRGYQQREKDAIRLELHTSELKTQLVRAQLGALKMQLQPHFLFNTLNAIMVLVRQQKTHEAEQMLARLSDLLRCVLEDVEAHEVPLRRELQYVEIYLSIEQVRFQDRLHVEITADPSVLDAAVPHMALQPIVENAIRHGIGRSAAAGRLHIRAARIDDTLELQVTDDGPGLSPSSLTPGGIGLANTRARLQQLYGTSATLVIENRAAGGVSVTLRLPYRAVDEVAEPELIHAHATEHADR